MKNIEKELDHLEEMLNSIVRTSAEIKDKDLDKWIQDNLVLVINLKILQLQQN